MVRRFSSLSSSTINNNVAAIMRSAIDKSMAGQYKFVAYLHYIIKIIIWLGLLWGDAQRKNNIEMLRRGLTVSHLVVSFRAWRNDFEDKRFIVNLWHRRGRKFTCSIDFLSKSAGVYCFFTIDLGSLLDLLVYDVMRETFPTADYLLERQIAS